MRIGLVQVNPVWENPAATRDRLRDLLAAAPHTDLLLFPEMCLTGFSMEAEKTALQPEDHAFFEQIASGRCCAVAYGGSEERQNVLVFRGRDGSRKHAYAKRHLFALGGEDRAYEVGNAEPTPWEWEDWRILPAICYDLRFGYHFWRSAAQTDLVTLVGSWPAARDAHWRALLVARAIENQCWVAAVNRTGNDPRIHHIGSSLVVDPNGDIVLDAGSEEGVFVVDIDRERVEKQRRKFPFLRDRKA